MADLLLSYRMLVTMATTPGGNRATVETLGVLAQERPARELASQPWDAIVVGAGHNGLACAAYLARSGQRSWWSRPASGWGCLHRR